MEDWAQIRYLRKQGLSIRKIAAEVGCAKKTVERALAADKPPAYKKRASTVTSFTPFEPQVRALLEQTPTLPATVIAERVGWTGSITWFRDNVRRIRPDYQPADPVDTLTHRPGEQIQCDLTFPAGGIPDETGARMPFPVLVASHSRFMAARVLPTRTTGDLIAKDVGIVVDAVSGRARAGPDPRLVDTLELVQTGPEKAKTLNGGQARNTYALYAHQQITPIEAYRSAGRTFWWTIRWPEPGSCGY